MDLIKVSALNLCHIAMFILLGDLNIDINRNNPAFIGEIMEHFVITN